MVRMLRALVTGLAIALLLVSPAQARSRNHSSHARSRTASGTPRSPRVHASPRAHASAHRAHARAQRNSRGKIKRSEAARRRFEAQTGYPHGRPGYVVDHIVPLACGGADTPSNMQWQSVAEAKAKDKVERRGC